MKAGVCAVVFLLVMYGSAFGEFSGLYTPDGHVLITPAQRAAYWWKSELKSIGIQGAKIGATVTSSGKPFAKMVELVVGPGKLKFLTAVAIQAGIIAGSYYLGEWLEEKNWWLEDDPLGAGKVVMGNGEAGPLAGVYPSGMGCDVSSLWRSSTLTTQQVSQGSGTFYAHNSAQSAAYECAKQASSYYVSSSTYCSGIGQIGSLNCNSNIPTAGFCGETTYTCWYWARCGDNYTYCTWNEDVPGWEVPIGDPGAISWEDVRSQIESDLNADNQNIVEAAKDSLASQGSGVEQSNSDWPLGSPGDWSGTGYTNDQGSDIQDLLNESISEDQKTDLYNETGANDPDNPYGGWYDWEYSPEDIASAIEKKLAPYLDPGTATSEDDPPPPDKTNLTEELDSFWGALPSIDSIFDGVEIDAAQSNCNFCIPRPQVLGLSGDACYSCCEHAGMLAAIGNILYWICGVGWLIFFFI